MKSKASLSVKRKAEPAPCIVKKLRSERPRCKRAQNSPVVLRSSLPCKEEGVPALSVYSSSSSFFDDDNVSCGSSRVTNSSSYRKKQSHEVKESGARNEGKDRIGDPTFRRITRSYYKQRESEREKNEAEVSESSCVESHSGADFVLRRLKMKKGDENLRGLERRETDVVSVTPSDVTCGEQVSNARNLKFSSENKENDAVLITSEVNFSSRSKFGTVTEGIDNGTSSEFELSEISKPNSVAEANFPVLNSESVVQQKGKPEIAGCDSDLACTELFSYEDFSDYSENAISELQSEIFPENSELNSSEYTPSIFFDSGSEFSERSYDDALTSRTYSLFLEFKEQFWRSTIPNTVKSPSVEEHYEIQPTLVRFEDDDEEESYQRLRERERRLVYLRDYAEDYSSRTGYGDLVLRQRLQMVQWIVEAVIVTVEGNSTTRFIRMTYDKVFCHMQCTDKELQQETMFLGVSLLDRFLSRGSFKTERNLQIVGISCLALATRIEENQPYNSVRQKNFCIQKNKYSRCEVVAMEWLVQEVLNFQCFTPTIYNFLWFYLKAAKADAEVETKAKYLAMLALSDHGHLDYWPSTVAAGLVILASIKSDEFAAYQRVIQIHVRTKDNDLPECVKSLEWLLSV